MNFFNFIRETHKASPTISAIVVEVVGAIPIEHASAAFGIIKLIFEALISSLSEFEEIPIIEIEYFLAKFKRSRKFFYHVGDRLKLLFFWLLYDPVKCSVTSAIDLPSVDNTEIP